MTAFSPELGLARESGRVLISGASGGIGGAIALHLARSGRRVLGLGRDPGRLRELESAARKAGLALETLRCDLTQEADWLSLGQAVGEVDTFIHGAAAFAPFGRLEQTSLGDLKTVLELGPHSVLRLCGLLMPQLKRRRFGRIVLLGSAAASLGAGGQAAYAASKASLIGIARSLALEGGKHGITCNVVELGLIDTPRIQRVMKPTAQEAVLQRSAARRLGTPLEVAHLVAYLISKEAGFMTGANLPFSGGLGLGVLQMNPDAGGS